MKTILDEPMLSEISRLFRALGEEARLRLLRVLLAADQPMSQKALAEATGLTQANASKHLIQLASAGLVTREPQGNLVLFRPVIPLVAEVCTMVCTHVADRIKSSYESIS